VKKILISLGSVISLGLPVIVMAAGQPNLNGYLGTAIGQGSGLLSSLVTLLLGLAVVWFIWNVIRYAMSNEDDGKEKAKSQMINGIIAIAVMVSIWGIVAILRGAFGVESGSVPNVGNMIPTVSSGGSVNSGSGFVDPTIGGLDSRTGNVMYAPH